VEVGSEDPDAAIDKRRYGVPEQLRWNGCLPIPAQHSTHATKSVRPAPCRSALHRSIILSVAAHARLL
jgi:hypothetical protein